MHASWSGAGLVVLAGVLWSLSTKGFLAFWCQPDEIITYEIFAHDVRFNQDHDLFTEVSYTESKRSCAY